MAQFSSSDLLAIRDEAAKHSARLNELKGELKDLLTQPSTPVLKSHKPPLSSTRPVLLSRVDGIQSRLPQLAAALSPSSRSTPLNRDHSASPRIRSARAVTSAASSSSDEGPDSADVLFELSRDRLSRSMAKIDAQLSSKMEELQQQRDSIERIKKELLVQTNEREKVYLAEVIDTINSLETEPHSQTFDSNFFKAEIENLRLHNSEVKHAVHAMISDERLHPIRQSLLEIERTVRFQDNEHEKFHTELARKAEQQVSKAAQQIKDHFAYEIAQIKKSVDRQPVNISGPAPVDSRLIDENAQLKKLVRRMKICLSKWRVDYLNHASSLREEQRTEESFTELARTLGRMWVALPPSGDELADFLVRLDRATTSRGSVTIASVMREECSRQVEKLPLAELAAQREYLLAKRSHSSGEANDLSNITDNLVGLIRDYEGKHGHKFFYDGREYLESVRRARVRG